MKPLTLDDLPSPPQNKVGWPWTEQSEILSDRMPDGSGCPRISIVTPSYNQGQFIEETIRSVLLQGYPNLEYIIIDGGSTDNSVEIIKKYESFLAYWVSERDRGQSDALNKGFSRAKGEICAYLNSDDLLTPNALKLVVDTFNQTNCRWLASKVLVGVSQKDADIWQPDRNYFPGFVVQQTFAQQGVFWQWNVIEKPYFDSSLQFIMDHDFFVKVYEKHGSPLILSEVTAFFRIHERSKTSLFQGVLEKESDQSIEKICFQKGGFIAYQIYLEKRRQKNRIRVFQLLEVKPQPLHTRVFIAFKSIQLLINSPYPFRDRIFWSVTIKLLIRIFFPLFA